MHRVDGAPRGSAAPATPRHATEHRNCANIASQPANTSPVNTTPAAGGTGRLRLILVTLEALFYLCRFDLIARRGFRRTREFTSRFKVSSRSSALSPDTVRWCVDEACVWYWKRAFCVQRSSVLAWMLRRRGMHATVVIGYRPVPVDSHAWVEIDGTIVNDRQEYRLFYRLLDSY
jgi:hypothetical protein